MQAKTRSPGCTQANAAVDTRHNNVTQPSSRFFAPCKSAQAPKAGMLSITSAYDTPNVVVHAKAPQAAPCATAPTKYAENTAVMTTVVNPELAKSYIAQPNTSRFRTPALSVDERAGELLAFATVMSSCPHALMPSCR